MNKTSWAFPFGSTSRPVPRLFSMAALALVLILAACGSKAAQERSGDKTVNEFVRRVNKIVRNEADWPQDLPEGVPEFTQGRIVSAQEGLTANGTSWTIRVAGVEEGGFEAYFDSLRSGGWETTVQKSDDGGTCSARTESLDLTLTFSGDHGILVLRMKTF